ncbi:MAG: DUF6984 family protein [Pirellulales bacterium]
MSRLPSSGEKELVLRLVGSHFSEVDVIEGQLESSRVRELSDGNVLEFEPLASRKLTTTKTVLGEGSVRDLDGVPVIISLLQRDGYLWRLDISRADGQRIRGPLNYQAVVALGFGQGVSLEDGARAQKE